MWWRAVGSSTALPLRRQSLVKARVRAGRNVTQALSTSSDCLSKPPAQEEGMSTAESAAVTRALITMVCACLECCGFEKKGCRPLRVAHSLKHSSNWFRAPLGVYGSEKLCDSLRVLVEGMKRVYNVQRKVLVQVAKVKIPNDSLCTPVNR